MSVTNRSMQLLRVAALLLLAWLGGCAAPNPNATGAIPEIRPGILAGYLSTDDRPDDVSLIPPPPATGSAALAMDEEVSRYALGLRGTARWALARRDAELMFPAAAQAFACAAGFAITPERTPALYRILRRTVADAGLASYPAKQAYQRPRPYLVNGKPICTPDEAEHLRDSGAYPSGHAAIGWAWALILAELVPDRSEAILRRGRAFGLSRVVCNVHWSSDVMMGRLLGAAVVSRLHADPVFRADREAARAEIAALRPTESPPPTCQLEKRARQEMAKGAPWPFARPRTVH